MDYKGRAQCLVTRDKKVLMVKHKQGVDEWYCSPGGGIEKGETPEQAAIRELREECNVSGTIIKKTSEYADPYEDNKFFYTFHIDIGDQTPSLGYDPEEAKTHSLIEVRWMSLDELSEMGRAFLWASGLLSITEFAEELESWSREISYPRKRTNAKIEPIEKGFSEDKSLQKTFDLNFLNQYGAVFKVVKYSEDSLNLCFGVEKDNKKYFVKFAATEEAIVFLKDAAQIYKDLAHENLIKFIKGEEAGGGYVNIFEWVDAECIGYPSPPSRQKFLNLPVTSKMQVFDDIMAFHAHVAGQGYVAIDFYADQILYDFENNRTIICDIDFYQKSPYYGDKGAWGSSNFVSPEELVPGSRVDEVTMVYTMGATAFSIFSDYDRSPEAWTLNKALYDIAKRAVSDERNERQQSIQQLITEWNAVK